MQVLSHRGYWIEPGEKNTIPAFTRSLLNKFGLETDIRDCCGRIVISHDMPSGEEIGFDQFIKLISTMVQPLALNIKADGLAVALKKELSGCNIGDWFAFDMSIPDMRVYLNERMPVFARVSEVERDPPWIDEVAGVWVDSFYGEHFDVSRIARYLDGGKRVCVVSPELHGRPHQNAWRTLRCFSNERGFMICTDYPERARISFATDP